MQTGSHAGKQAGRKTRGAYRQNSRREDKRREHEEDDDDDNDDDDGDYDEDDDGDDDGWDYNGDDTTMCMLMTISSSPVVRGSSIPGHHISGGVCREYVESMPRVCREYIESTSRVY